MVEDKDKKLSFHTNIPKMTREANYRIDLPWGHLKKTIEQWANEGKGLDLDPDFQRDHVWTEEQQVAFVEYKLSGGFGSEILLFNCPGGMMNQQGPIELVDGKQRIQAVLDFIDNKFSIFGGAYRSDFGKLPIMSPLFRLCINNLRTRAQVLKWYLEINSGGTVHTKAELQNVRNLLSREL